MSPLALLAALAAAPAHAICGDGALNSDEGCDDGDTSSGDGCSKLCQVEAGWTCQPGTLESNLVEVLYDETEYPAGFHQEPLWSPDAAGLRVTQKNNAKASLYVTNLAMNSQTVELIVRAGAEGDDAWGLAVGYQPGDKSAGGADWLLLDWNRAERRSPDCRAPAGLAVSRVTGPIESVDDLWCHRGAVEELDRGNNMGLTGWPADQDIRVRLEYSRTALRITLDGQPELEVLGSFPDGALALYALSQQDLSFELVSPAQTSACAGLDTDDDLVSDPREVYLGLNPQSADSDRDGVSDAEELGRVKVPPDSDQDGVINALDDDDEGDGVPTLAESRDGDSHPENDDSDGDRIPDYLDADDDGDGLLTAVEVYGTTDPLLQDTDGDGLPDFVDIDDDGDGIPTALELRGRDGAIRDSDGDGLPDYRDADDDGDGVPTAVESWDGDHDPRNDDTDRDGVPDYLDQDDDGDGKPTAEETLESRGTRDVDADGRPDHVDLEIGEAQRPPERKAQAKATPSASQDQRASVAEELIDQGMDALATADESLGAGGAVDSMRSTCGCSAPAGPAGWAGLSALPLVLLFRRQDPRHTDIDVRYSTQTSLQGVPHE